MTTPACVVHPTRQAPPPLPDSKACAGCVAGLEQDLTDIDRLLPVLRSMLEPGRTGTDGIRGSGFGYRAPINLGVMALLDPRSTDGPDTVLPRWAKAAGVPPTGAGIRGRMSWFVEQPDDLVRALFREIRALAAELRRVCGPAHGITEDPPPAPRRVALCRRETRPGHECGGAIVVAPADTVAVCQRCREGWPRERWPFLARLQDA